MRVAPPDGGRPRARAPGPGPPSGVPAPGADFDGFVRDHLPRLLAYAVVLTGDRHLAADVVQTALVRAHDRWPRVRGAGRPDLYVKRIVTNEYLSWRRRWYVRAVVPVADDVLAARAGGVADHAEQLAERDRVRRLLGGLPRRPRAVLVLRYYEGFDDAGIAELLGVAPSTVRATASRALAALRTTADPGEDDR